MTAYRLDDLGWARFEELCQSLLKACLGLGVEAWGGRSDLGRDAFAEGPLPFHGPGSSVPGPFVFQAKFVAGASAAGARPGKAVRAAAAAEAKQIQRRLADGSWAMPAYYVFLTNAPLSAPLRRDLRRCIEEVLPASHVITWGRDDIGSMLHIAPDVRNAFPELVGVADVMQLIRASGGAILETPILSPADEIPPEIKCILEEADKAESEGRYGDALEAYDQAEAAADAAQCAAAQLRVKVERAGTLLNDERDVSTTRDTLLTCLASIPKDAKFVKRDNVLSELGEAELLLGNIEAGRSAFREAVHLARERQDRFAEAMHLIGLGRAEELLGEFEEAHRLLRQAEELCRAEYRDSIGEDRKKAAVNLGVSLSSMAVLLRREGKLADAMTRLSRAEPLFREANSIDNLGRTLAFRGEIQLMGGQWENARNSLRASLSTFEALGNVNGQCRCLEILARLFLTHGLEDQAAACLARALALAATARPERESIRFLFQLALLCRDHDRGQASVDFLVRAKELATMAGDEAALARCLMLEAESLGDDASPEERERLLRGALVQFEAAAEKSEIRGRRAELAFTIGKLHGRLGNRYEARRWLEHARREHEAIGDAIGLAETLALLAAVAREEDSRGEAIALLERMLEIAKEADLHDLRAGGLHDLGMLKLDQGEIAEARRCLDESKTIADRYRLESVADVLNFSRARLSDVERSRTPPFRGLPELLKELHGWCACIPKHRHGILPLWYHFHSGELWGICRSMLGVKFLICCSDVTHFRRTAAALEGHGDLYVWGTPFDITENGSTELIPLPREVEILIPPHVTLAGIKREKNIDPDTYAKAMVKALRKEVYVLVAFDEEAGRVLGSRLCAFGRRLRLPKAITSMMLDTPVGHLIGRSWICLPVRQGNGMPGMRHVMNVAWENRMVPLIHERNLAVAGVELTSVCDCALELPKLSPGNGVSPADAAKLVWENLLTSCQDAPHQSLREFSRAMASLPSAKRPKGQIRIRVSLLQFQSGTREIIHPAVLVPGTRI
ncbi:MAG TPA: tetratricopeptide repeat protein [Longimicrobium sp.]|jgi:tetratricopeptide (TPR) repeat protein